MNIASVSPWILILHRTNLFWTIVCYQHQQQFVVGPFLFQHDCGLNWWSTLTSNRIFFNAYNIDDVILIDAVLIITNVSVTLFWLFLFVFNVLPCFPWVPLMSCPLVRFSFPLVLISPVPLVYHSAPSLRGSCIYFAAFFQSLSVHHCCHVLFLVTFTKTCYASCSFEFIP